MNDKSANPFSLGQIEADLFMASAAIQKAESMSSKAGKFYRGQFFATSLPFSINISSF